MNSIGSAGWELAQRASDPIDLSAGVLYRYVAASKVRLCPALNYTLPQFKLKADSPVCSYGYNVLLSPGSSATSASISRIRRPTETALFADAAQVNDFQSPASRANPMLEEWYYLDNPTNYPSANYYPHGHFRHSRKASVVFCDGHVGSEGFVSGSIDPKLPSQLVGRFRPGDLSCAVRTAPDLPPGQPKERGMAGRSQVPANASQCGSGSSHRRLERGD